MVIKGSARAAPGELAYHLLREDTNEAVRVMEFSGVASLDLREALAELDGMGAGSRSRRTLYHASINTPVSEQLNEQQQRIARNRLAAQLGLAGQPFAMVEHVKAGRQHTHVVWSRIDIETGKAIPDSHNYRKHEEVSRELELEFGHGPVIGAHVRDKETQPRPERGPTWAEQRQAERSGMTPAVAKTAVSELWRQTTTGRDFLHRLEAEGFIVARGDRRDFVLIDQAGEIHGLTRRIEGAKAAQVRNRMADVDVDGLPDVASARHQLRQRQKIQEQTAAQAFTSASERLRADELKQEAQATRGSRPSLRNSDQETADALWQLGKTMGGQLDAIVVSGRSDSQQLAVRPEPDAQRVRLESQTPAVPSEERQMPTGPAKRPLLKRLASWIGIKEQDALSSSVTPAQEERRDDAATILAAASSEAPQRPFTEVENRAGERNRPSAYLFIRIFGYLVDAYQQALDRSLSAEQQRQTGEMKRAEQPAREDLIDQILRDRANRTEGERESARAAALLRQQESRPQDRGRDRQIWEPDRTD